MKRRGGCGLKFRSRGGAAIYCSDTDIIEYGRIRWVTLIFIDLYIFELLLDKEISNTKKYAWVLLKYIIHLQVLWNISEPLTIQAEQKCNTSQCNTKYGRLYCKKKKSVIYSRIPQRKRSQHISICFHIYIHSSLHPSQFHISIYKLLDLLLPLLCPPI